MVKFGVIGVIFVLLAAAVWATFQTDTETGNNASFSYSGAEGITERLALLEQGIESERQHRVQLQSELDELKQQNAELSEWLANSTGTTRNGASAVEDGDLPEIENNRNQNGDRRNNNQDPAERQLNALVSGGFDEYQAQEIIRLSEEIQVQILNAQYEASLNGERANTGEILAEASQQLRTSLGEQDYEKYLEATNQSTSVGIRNVLESSSAQLAGLQEGDDIISYNGERVFNVNELNRLSSSADISGNVVVEVLRDGIPTTVALPPGPLGITTGGGGMGGGGGR